MASVIFRTATVAELHALDPFVDRPAEYGEITGPEVWVCDQRAVLSV